MIALVALSAALAVATATPDVGTAPAHVVKAALPAAPVAAMPDMSKWDPEHPPAAWLQKMVRPCARSGNRLVC